MMDLRRPLAMNETHLLLRSECNEGQRVKGMWLIVGRYFNHVVYSKSVSAAAKIAHMFSIFHHTCEKHCFALQRAFCHLESKVGRLCGVCQLTAHSIIAITLLKMANPDIRKLAKGAHTDET